MKHLVFIIAILLFTLKFAVAQPSPSQKTLHELFESHESYLLAEYPERATYRGIKTSNHRLTDYRPTAIAARQAYNKEMLNKLSEIKRDDLPPVDQLNYDLFSRNFRIAVADAEFFEHLLPIDQLGGPQLSFPGLVSITPFETEKDYDAYIKRLAAVPRYLNEIIDLMEAGRKTGWMHTQMPLRGVAAQIEAQYAGPTDSLRYFHPFLNFPDRIDEETREQLITQGRNALETHFIPAFKKLHRYFVDTYYPAAYAKAGAWQFPNGKAFYENRVAFYTTTSLSPTEVHEIGKKEVARIRGEMAAIISSLNFEGSFQDFLYFLRTDPQFYYTKAEDLLMGYRDICKRIDPELAALFGKLPRTPYGVREIPAFEAPTTYTGYYNRPSADGKRAGYFYANTYKLETRPKYEMEALAIHEAMPGHHLQIALAMELENVPTFRQRGNSTAFVEGWALYSESLGETLGLYQDPYSKFGQLTYEMWRACRLVVDTGMHYFQWTRQQAIDFMKENTAKTEHDISNEVDRYIVWPGQALAYKIGELKIKELRLRCENSLGDRFDIREFHDKILENGAIPLDVLEGIINEFIQAKLSLPE